MNNAAWHIFFIIEQEFSDITNLHEYFFHLEHKNNANKISYINLIGINLQNYKCKIELIFHKKSIVTSLNIYDHYSHQAQYNEGYAQFWWNSGFGSL